MKGINSFKHVLNFISNTEVPDAMKVEEEKEDDEDDLWFIYSFYLLLYYYYFYQISAYL